MLCVEVRHDNLIRGRRAARRQVMPAVGRLLSTLVGRRIREGYCQGWNYLNHYNEYHCRSQYLMKGNCLLCLLILSFV
jgi:hypothetical protein